MSDQTNIYLQRTKTVLKFVWRHFLTIPVVSLLALGIIAGNENIICLMGFFTFVAIGLDHGKCNRSTCGAPRRDSSFDEYRFTTTRIETWNPHQAGTPEYIREQGRGY